MSERHAQSSELGQAVQLDAAETLMGDPGDDALDSGYVPPDRPSSAVRSELAGGESETLTDKLRQEAPDDAREGEPDRSGRLIASDGNDVLGADVGIDGGASSAEEAAMHNVDDTNRSDSEDRR